MMASGGQALGRGRGQRGQQSHSPPRFHDNFERPGMQHRQGAGDGPSLASSPRPGARGRAKKGEKPVYIPKPKRLQMEMEAQREAGIRDQHYPQSSSRQYDEYSHPAVLPPHNGMPAETRCISDEDATAQHQRLEGGSASPRIGEKKPSTGRGRREREIYVPRARRGVDSMSHVGVEGSAEHSSSSVMPSCDATARYECEVRLHQEHLEPHVSARSSCSAPESSATSGKKSSKAHDKSLTSKETPEARRKSKTKKTEATGEASQGKKLRRKKKSEQNSPGLSVPHRGEAVPSVPSNSVPVSVGHSQDRISESPEMASESDRPQACVESTGLDEVIPVSVVSSRNETKTCEEAAAVDSSVGAKPSGLVEPSFVLGGSLHFEEVDDYLVDNDDDQDSVGVSGSMMASQEDQVSSTSQDKGNQYGGVVVNSQDNTNTCPVDLSDQLLALSVETTDSTSSQENDTDKSVGLEAPIQADSHSCQEVSTYPCSVQAKLDGSTAHQLEEQQTRHQPSGTAVAEDDSSVTADSVEEDSHASCSEAAKEEESTDVQELKENSANEGSGGVAAKDSSPTSGKDPMASASSSSKAGGSEEPAELDTKPSSTPQHGESIVSEKPSNQSSDSTERDPVTSASLPSEAEGTAVPDELKDKRPSSAPQHSETVASEKAISPTSGSTGKNSPQGSPPEEDSWEALFDEDGDFVEDSVKEEISSHVGKVKVKKAQKTIDYLSYKPRPRSPDGNLDDCDHLIEIYDFPERFKDADLINIFRDYKDRGFDLKWVDDTHAIGVFASAPVAVDALSQPYPCLKVRRISEASQQTRHKVKRRQEFLQPYKERPETTSMVAKNLIANHLGLRSAGQNKEKREQQRKQLREAKERRRQKAQAQEDAWEGTIKNMASADKA